MASLLKRFLLVICLSIPLVLIACGNGEEGEGTAENTSANESSTESTDGNSSESTQLKVASNNTQTSWYMFTGALSNLMREASPVSANVDVLSYAGGVGNAELVNNGEADFAVSFNITNDWAYNGKVAYEEPMENLRGLAGGINQYYIGVIASNDFLEEHNIESLHDIRAKEIPVNVITNPDGTLAEYSTRLTLEAYGMDYDMIEDFGGSVELTSNDVIKSNFQSGKADLHILAMTKAHPVITEIAIQSDITVMPMEEDIIEEMEQYGYKQETFPAGEFEGQEEDVTTGGFVASYITSDNMDEEVAYTIAKTVTENKDALVEAHSSVSDFEPEQVANPELIGIPLHPGAERYYEEEGLLD
ncbi:TAXI family TRAP transporter solute-binding subunit [Alteribacillus sp. YIM 98480]|uniref:TAXI family TRAP transporter solute-binding subunit n=1 Tax=Alteribacillus sp. YIM 98480 TaxID=2606599 RepID=UPI00131C36CB|nr:TAXI family TRAP transporter solute-binding subunit [Alteribacillus sp. YIM 98480]